MKNIIIFNIIFCLLTIYVNDKYVLCSIFKNLKILEKRIGDNEKGKYNFKYNKYFCENIS